MTSPQIAGALTMLGCAFLSAVSQIFLKHAANRHRAGAGREYLNGWVLAAYAIFAVTVLLNIWAFRTLDYKYGGIIMASSYVFVLILSRLCLRETVSPCCYWGNALIVAGISLYLCG